MRVSLVPAPLIAAALMACAAGDDGGDSTEWTTTRSTAGDTAVVRTSGVDEGAALRQVVVEWSIGSEEGNTPYSFGQISDVAVGPANDLFVYDRQPHSLRQYDSTGTYVRTIGRHGQGPGEYTGANGLVVHRDGRIVLWDFGNRMNFYSATGEVTGSTPVPGGGRFSTTGAVTADTLGNTYIRSRVGDPPAGDDMQRSGRMFGITGLVRYDPNGIVVDSITPPEILIDAPRLIAQANGGTSMNMVPHSPQFVWTFSPFGYFVSGRTDVYAIDLTTPGGKVTRIEMDAQRVAVPPEEKGELEASTTASMRMTDPNWRWNGAPIPDVKPYFRSLSVASDGRIWVWLTRPTEEIPVAEREEARKIGGITFPVTTRREPTVYDVFEGDGRYVGRVALPLRARWRGARGDIVWAVTRDSLDVERVTRYRVQGGLAR